MAPGRYSRPWAIGGRHGSRFAILACLALVACSNRDRGGASSADSHAPGTTDATVAAACSAYPMGSAGVIRTFCDGPATVNLTIAGVLHTMKGGTCEGQDGPFTLNLGVISGPGLAGPKPDYIGLSTPNAGPFTNAVLSVTVDGKDYAVPTNAGQVGAQGGAFSGTAMTGEAISGAFTC